MWEGRSKDRREKSKYTEWECGDSSWDNLFIWFPSHSHKQPTAEWICLLITLCLLSVSLHWVPGPAPCCRLPLAALPCTQHLHPARACSHLKVLSPNSSLALVHGDRWGDCDSAPFCHCIILFSLGLETGLEKHISFPSWFVTEGERKLFFSP